MKISYDKVTEEYVFPLSRKDVALIMDILPPEIVAKIRRIRFVCNRRTTQEGRFVGEGDLYDIKVNFCLKNSKSRLLATNRKYINEVEQMGGQIDRKSKSVTWSVIPAKRYCAYILLHETGHIVFCEKYSSGRMGMRGTQLEEQWCDKYAMEMVKKIDFSRDGK